MTSLYAIAAAWVAYVVVLILRANSLHKRSLLWGCSWTMIAHIFLIGYGLLTFVDFVIFRYSGESLPRWSKMYPDPESMQMFQFIWLAGTFAFTMGTLTIRPKQHLEQQQMPYPKIPISSAFAIVLTLLMVGSVILFYARLGALSNPSILLDRTALMYAANQVRYRIPYGCVMSVVIAFLFLGSGIERFARCLTFATFALLYAFLVLVTGARKPLIDLVCAALVFRIYCNRPLMTKALLVTTCAISILAITYYDLRGPVMRYVLGSRAVQTTTGQGLGFLNGDGGSAYYVVLDGYYNRMDLSEIWVRSPLVSVAVDQLPTSLFPGTKPPSVNELYNRSHGYSGGFSIPLFAFGLFEFGFPGYLFVAVVAGVLMRLTEVTLLAVPRFGALYYVGFSWIAYYIAISDLAQFFIAVRDGVLVLSVFLVIYVSFGFRLQAALRFRAKASRLQAVH